VYCSKCGATLAADVAFCTVCGTPVLRSTLANPPLASPPFAHPAVGAVAAHAGGLLPGPAVTYAGFWLRFVAHLIDGLILSAATFAVVIPLIFLTGLASHFQTLPRHSGEPVDPAAIAAIISLVSLFVLASILIQWLYYAYLESGEKQATWGKQALGLYVTDVAGQRISFGRASGRFFAKVVTGLIPLGIGYIMAGFTERRQALHDMIASCLVLRR
jgi:uncharacterized RDD family membrane protein YckC